MIVDEELYHYGTPRHSGRYPWGSGENPYQRNQSFLGYVNDLKKQGLTEKEIAKGLGMSTGELRAKKAIANSYNRKEDVAMAIRLKEKGYSNVAIGKRMGINESSVRNLLNLSIQERFEIAEGTSKMLRENVDAKGAIDIGIGVENHLGISRTKLMESVEILKQEGYKVQYVDVEQLGTGNKTKIMVLTTDDTQWKDLVNDKSLIKSISEYSEDDGKTYYKIEKPRSVNSDRIEVVYAEDGGIQKDGLIELRRGVDDISLGNARYAQVRIAVDDTHYLKGMAVYSDDLPDGVDIRFNTNKSNTGNKKDAMKSMKDDPDNPFGATIRTQEGVELMLAQRHYTDQNGKTQLSCLNIVNEEGNWGEWSKTIASQVLSKQSPTLAKKLLGIAYDEKKDEYDEIMSLTNPTIKKKLLESFADDCDSSAIHLKAAAMPRQATHVILPFPNMKENEIYAPNYENGTDVVLIRYPHGGIFEIPQLKVNNKNSEAKKILGNAKDAVGINHKVAEQLSGADFDGDTVLVIPNRGGVIKTSSPLEKLKNFDPKVSYKLPAGQKGPSEDVRNNQMGIVSNLITDMTIKGASTDEICRAVRHSMVVIDSSKHNLDYKKSYVDNNIKELQKKYQDKGDGKYGGSSTLISRAKSAVYVPERKENYKPNAKTGEIEYTYTNATYVKKTTSKSGTVKTETKSRLTKTTQMAETKDAHTLSSGTPIENVYADHANKLKALGNQARKSALETPKLEYSPSAAKTYSTEVASLNAKLNTAYKNKPLERQAQILANEAVKSRLKDNPGMTGDELKKVKGQQLTIARNRVGAHKQNIVPTTKEWEAIQSGAIRNNKLIEIINNSNLDTIKQLATPRSTNSIPTAVINKAKFMLDTGYTQAEVADRLGISVSTINRVT